MAISWIRKAIINFNFFQFSFRSEDGEELPDKTIFDELSSEELHYLASIYNWDDGPTVLNWIVESPKCDLGTAIMIFWLAEPDYYFKYPIAPIEEIDLIDLEVWQLLQLILEKIRKERFFMAEQEFSPIEAGYEANPMEAKGIWTLPAIVQNGISTK
jgi:hypothetical protein